MVEKLLGGDYFESKVVLLSGGVDSATCLGMAVDCYGNKEVTALSYLLRPKSYEKELA